MFYTDIQKLLGLTVPADYGSGIEYADGLLDYYYYLASSKKSSDSATADTTTTVPALQIGLWLNGTAGCADLVAGRLDPQVAQLYRYLMMTNRWRKIFLRVGYEFDNPYFGYSSGDPALFRAAFRYMVDACHAWYSRAACSDRIAFVWHSWGAGGGLLAGNNNNNNSNNNNNATITLNDFYPGDDYVDWIGVSLFSQLYTDPKRQTLGNRETVTAVLDFAANNCSNKPVMIAESTPFGGIDTLADPWNDWFEPVLQLIDEYDISMWSYINCDWDSQPMWHNVGFGESRLSTNATIMKLWKERVLDNPRFVTKLSNDCQEQEQQQQPQLQEKRLVTGAFLGESMVEITSGTVRRNGDSYQGNAAEGSVIVFSAATVVLVLLLLPLLIGYLGLFRRRRTRENRNDYYMPTPTAADQQEEEQCPARVLAMYPDYGSLSKLSNNAEL